MDEAARLEARECFYPRPQERGTYVFHIPGKKKLPNGQPVPGEKKSIEKAMDIADRMGVRLPIWAQDLPNPQEREDMRGNKCFKVGSYMAFRDYYREMTSEERCIYEIVRDGEPTKIHVDLDAQRQHNPHLDDATFQKLYDVVISEIVALVNEIRAAPADTPVAYIVLDSSKLSKISKHIIFELFLRNNYHCGAFMRMLRTRITKKYESAAGVGDSNNDHPYYMWAEVKDPLKPKSGVKILVRTFFTDMAIYTMRRNFRIYGSRKRITGALALLAEGESPGAPFNWAAYDRCLLQRRSIGDPVYDCLEEDGSEPVSRGDRQATKAKSTKTATTTHRFAPATHLTSHWATIFPYQVVFDVLAPVVRPPGAPDTTTYRRAFQFTYLSGTWARLRVFDSSTNMHDEVLKALPAVIHIGPVRAVDAAGLIVEDDREPFQPTLVFDVDIKDSLIPRPCCGVTGAACGTCWPIASFAQRAICAFAQAMDLGTPVCFFSGCKGIHVWLLGATRLYKSEAREGLIAYLSSVVTDGSTKPGDSYTIPDREAGTTPNFVQSALGSELERRQLATFVCDTMGLRTQFERHAHCHGRDSAITHVLWPRIDVQVTRDPSHKIKAPFCVHARTSRVCVWLENATVNPYTTDIDPLENAAALVQALSPK